MHGELHKQSLTSTSGFGRPKIPHIIKYSHPNGYFDSRYYATIVSETQLVNSSLLLDLVLAVLVTKCLKKYFIIEKTLRMRAMKIK